MVQVLGSAKGAVATFVSWLVFKNPVTVSSIMALNTRRKSLRTIVL